MNRVGDFQGIIDKRNSTYYPGEGDPWESSSSSSDEEYVVFIDSVREVSYLKQYSKSMAAPPTHVDEDSSYDSECEEAQIRKGNPAKKKKNRLITFLAADLECGKMDAKSLDKCDYSSK